MNRAADETTVVGFIGLGVMGGAMCRNLAARAGVTVAAYDADPDACAACVAGGAAAVEGPAHLARECGIIFLSLPGEAEVRDVCRGEDGLLAHARDGQIIVDCSTVPVSLSREMAAAFAGKGASYVDAPVAGTAETVADRKISIMVGAEDAVFTRLAPLLDCMAEQVQHCGPSGSGTTTKLLLNMVIAQSVVALAEALSLGRKAGLDGDRLFQAFQHGCDSFALRQHGMTALLPGVFPEGKFPTRYMLKDLGYVLALKEELNLKLDGMVLTHELLQRAVAAGHGDAYWPALINVIGQDERHGQDEWQG
ncbi:MAG: NAD(P)-dependent oxidoreductase [Alphaproteobacteria bacterium]|nr:NAD(P)-dependent oxidoreductase [Alphaproteobacteria bacterium]